MQPQIEPPRREPIFQKHGLIWLAYAAAMLVMSLVIGEIIWRAEDWLIWSRLGW